MQSNADDDVHAVAHIVPRTDGAVGDTVGVDCHDEDVAGINIR